MVVLRGVKKGLGVWIRKKLGRAGAPDPRDIYGIYQVRTRFNRRTQVKEVFYTPTNPQTVPQQANRQNLANIVAEWQGLTDEQKDYYNKLKAPTGMSGYNRYIRFCMLDPSGSDCPMASFLSLLDTPVSYSGQAGKYVLVNAGEDALEFGEIAAANKALSNLENVAINISLIPAVDSVIDLGSPTKFFANAHIDKIWFDSEITFEASAVDRLEVKNTTGNFYFRLTSANASMILESLNSNFYIWGRGSTGFQILTSKINVGKGGTIRIVFASLGTGFPRLRPYVDSTGYLGGSTNYWSLGYIDKLYLNATAILDGAVAGHIKFTGDLVPATDDTEWIGEIGSPFKAIKGLVIKDTTDGKHYKVEVVNGVLTATALD